MLGGCNALFILVGLHSERLAARSTRKVAIHNGNARNPISIPSASSDELTALRLNGSRGAGEAGGGMKGWGGGGGFRGGREGGGGHDGGATGGGEGGDGGEGGSGGGEGSGDTGGGAHWPQV